MRAKFKIIALVSIGFLSMQSCNTLNGNKLMKDAASRSQPNLLKAVSEKDTQLVRDLLSSKPDLETKDDKGRTPLMIAAYNNDNKTAELLIAAGADVNAQDDMQNSPFLYAGANGNVDLLKLSLVNDANFKIYNRYGGTALIPAAEKGHLEVVKILTRIPYFPIGHVNKLGWTALLEAIILSERGETQVAIVKSLVEAGSDVSIADKDGVTPLRHAKDRSMDKIVEILSKAKPRP